VRRSLAYLPTYSKRVPRALTVRLALSALLVALPGCSGAGPGTVGTPRGSTGTTLPAPAPTPVAGVYTHTGPADLSPAVAGVPGRVYVPNTESDSVDVIDPATFRIVDHFGVGHVPQHIAPAWDLKTLYVTNNNGNSLTPIDPVTGKPGPPIPVDDPYNLYFTPDGAHAVVVAEALRRIDIRDPHTWALQKSIPTPCDGVDHGDFTADGKEMLLSCEFSGQLLRVDLTTMEMTGTLTVGGSPVDVRLSPDGSVFLVANQKRNGVSVVDIAALREIGFVPTGGGAHGLYPSRDASVFYVSNRAAGSVSVLDAATRTVTTTWKIGGSPDMGGVSTDGTQLWLTGRYHRSVYVIDTRTGKLLHTIKVGRGPHGLCLFPQPGRLSLGHTGNYR
jgi:YVTN family beta-propeller protein